METQSIEQIISDLIDRSSRLKWVAEQLAQEYRVELPPTKAFRPQIPNFEGLSSNGSAKNSESIGRAGGRGVKKGVRIAQIREYLQEHGAQTRREILNGTGIPVGTLGSILTQYASRDEQGKWSLKDENEE